MKRKTKIVLVAGTLVVLAGVGIAAAAAGGEDARGVRVAEAEIRDLESVVRASGWIQPRVAVDVQSDIMGRVTALNVEEGDVVERGQVLLRIDPTQYEAAVAQARASVSQALANEARARASMIQARQELRRTEDILARDSTLISPRQYEDARTQAEVQQALHEAAEHGVEVARASLREAEDRLAKSVIRAPIDGVVTRLNIEEGETAIVGTMNNPGSLLLTVSDLSVMEAVVRVDETDVPGIELGDSTTLTVDAFRRRQFTGRVTEISHSSVVDPNTRGMSQQAQAVDFEVVVTLDRPPPGIRPDLSATAEVITEQRPRALAIPIIALTVRERKDVEALESEQPEAQAAAEAMVEGDEDIEGVFVIRDGQARFVAVDVGITGREHFEILSGLTAGDSVVAGPYEAIRQLNDGDPVRVLPESGDVDATTTEQG
ncbi:MAG: efflux RND transporter periplasmic adaptor subunit [Longimicrobiales bacterium]|nr:efflux RND transporter periplasmic adaptor subunit [Longimicrobiales bacterium]